MRNANSPTKDLKISILVPGRLHGFDMALYFQKLGLLNELVTGYPKRYISPFGIDIKLAKSLYINELINRSTNWLRLGYPLDFLACEAFDYLASKLIKFDSDVYFIWSSYGLRTIKAIRKRNKVAKIILVRGSTHIEEQEMLLKTVNKSRKQQVNSKIIAKELKEYQEADYITVPSTFAYKSFIKWGFSPDRLFLNPLGVDLSQFPLKKEQSLSESITFGNVGTLSRRKNVSSLIDVLTKLNVGSKFKLILAGALDYKSFEEKSLLKDFIKYFGKINQRELKSVYEKIDVFVINSVEEGLAMVQLQAMSSGCPIISTYNSGAEDIIKNYENGIMIPALNDGELEKAILWFEENKSKIPEMGQLSRKIADDGFSWDDFGRRNMEFIAKITVH